jgi:hypothetical protein
MIRKEMESLGLYCDIDSLGLETNDNNSSYLKNKISLEEVRNVSNDHVGDLKTQFMESYEQESKQEDKEFTTWQGEGDEDEENHGFTYYEEGDGNNAVYCQIGLFF